MDCLELERKIIEMFKNVGSVIWNNQERKILSVAKPIVTSGGGECKTDVYIQLDNQEEIKISIKKTNADFLENKITAERAESLFGKDYKEFFQKSMIPIQDKFIKKQKYFPEKTGRIEANSYTLGWRIDIIDKLSGELCVPLQIPKETLLHIISGDNLPDLKKHCSVNGTVVKNSGIANYFLQTDNPSSAQEVLDNLIHIEDYNSNVYLTFRAVNFRKNSGRCESRHLGVYVTWENGEPECHFDNPLGYTSTMIRNKYKGVL